MRKTTEEAAQRQLEHGLPGEFLHGARLIFAANTRTLLFHFALERNEVRIPQLFLRSLDVHRYTNLFDYAESLDSFGKLGDRVRGVRSPTLGPDDVLYFLLTEHGAADGRTHMNVTALGRMDLSSRRLACWNLNESDHGPTPVELLGADDGGVYAKAGIATPLASHMGRGHTIDYAVARFCWSERSVAVLAELPAIFY